MNKFSKFASALVIAIVCVSQEVRSDEKDILAVVELTSISLIKEKATDGPPSFYRSFMATYDVLEFINGKYDKNKIAVRLFWHYDGAPDIVGNKSIAKFMWSDKYNMFAINAKTLTKLTPLKNGTYGVCGPGVAFSKDAVLKPLEVANGYVCKYGMPLENYLKEYATRY